MDNVFVIISGNDTVLKIDYKNSNFISSELFGGRFKNIAFVKVAAGEGGIIFVTDTSSFIYACNLSTN